MTKNSTTGWTLFGFYDDAGELHIDHAVRGQHEDEIGDDETNSPYQGWCDSFDVDTLEAARGLAYAQYGSPDQQM